MSQDSIPPPEHNPYRSPEALPSGFAPEPSGQVPLEPPTFAKVMVILDLALCVLTGFLAFATALTVIVVAKTNPTVRSQYDAFGALLYFDMVTDWGMVVTSVVADIALFTKRRWGLPLGAIAVAFTLASLALAIPMAVISHEVTTRQTPGLAGVSTALSVLRSATRLGLLGMYVVALLQFARYFRRVAETRFTGFAR